MTLYANVYHVRFTGDQVVGNPIHTTRLEALNQQPPDGWRRIALLRVKPKWKLGQAEWMSW